MLPSPITKDKALQHDQRMVPRHAPLGRRQRTILLHFEAVTCVVLFLGLLAGMVLAGGSPLLGGFDMLIGLILLEPLAFSSAMARRGRYRAAAMFSSLAGAAYAVLAMALLTVPAAALFLADLGPLAVLIPVVFLAGASVTALRAASTLWSADPGPALLGSDDCAPVSTTLTQ